MNASNTLKIVSQNKIILNILSRIETIANSDCAVLLLGETGTGKELFAEYIHHCSNRSQFPFVKVALSSLPPDLLESELFGSEKGAFTGAMNEKKGLFEIADKGTIFLDDIDDFPFNLQSKLLRVLEAKEVKRIGAQSSLSLDIRLITSTKVDLRTMAAQNQFRMDLFFRINVYPIEIPPLRERIDDIPILAEHFLNYFVPNKKIEISEAALEALKNYSWPGNVRELRNIIQSIALFCNGKITPENLPSEFYGSSPLDSLIKKCQSCFNDKNFNFEQVMSCVESHLLEQALTNAEGNRTLAARMLGLSLSTFRDKLKKHNLD
ncbi:MAG: sigma-54 interaction domain-containing protein [Ignavibacteriaceae bacterium]